MNSIALNNPGRIEFGPSSIQKLVPDYADLGIKRVFLLAAKPVMPDLENLLEELMDKGIEIYTDSSLLAEPTLGDLRRICAEADEFRPDSVAGIGGGSVMDLAKLVATFTGKKFDIRDYFGSGLVRERDTHLVCIPTTSGTGSEVSPNSILLDESDQSKKGIISPFLVPDAAYVDPELCLGLPPGLTAHTGMDAFTHCLEAYTNRFSHPVIDKLAFEGIRLINSSLESAYRDGSDLESRTGLALGSMYGGMCLGPVNTAAVHALAYPLGSEYGIGHGLSNAVLLPHVSEFNMRGPAKEKYAGLDRAMGIPARGGSRERAAAVLERIRELMENCGIPSRLRDLGIEESALTSMADSAFGIKRLLGNNPEEIGKSDILDIYRSAF